MEIEAKRKKEEEDRILQEKANQAAAVSYFTKMSAQIPLQSETLVYKF